MATTTSRSFYVGVNFPYDTGLDGQSPSLDESTFFCSTSEMNEGLPFDEDGPPPKDAGLFGLSPSRDDAKVVVTQAPFEATVSYGAGTAAAPSAIIAASHQVDLFDLDVGCPTRAGIFLAEELPEMAASSARARLLAEQVIDALEERTTPQKKWLSSVNAASAEMVSQLEAQTLRVLDDDKLPFLIGGDHSVAEGPIRAVASRIRQLTLLQFDAHADLRIAYEGFEHSHASVMHNVLQDSDKVKLVQVGVRDLCEPEMKRIESDSRITPFTGRDLRLARDENAFSNWVSSIADACTENVYITFDVDGLDPTLCPHTGTPVPGGLSFDEALSILEAVSRKSRIVGGDLVEVGNHPWDALVGARLLHKMIGYSLRSHGL